jgi:uncharacterized protein YndB with AHSA1/START domain
VTSESDPTRPVARLVRHLHATPEQVFDAWLDADGLKQWMCPSGGTVSLAEIDPRHGGRFRVVMSVDGEDHDHTGEYRELRRPDRLVFSWVSPATKGESLVTVDLQRSNGQTELILTHELLPDDATTAKHVAGWGEILERLKTKLRGGS